MQLAQLERDFFCPGGQICVIFYAALVGEGDAAGVEHGRGNIVPGAVFVVAHQGIPPAGKLHPDLVTAPGV